MDNHRRRPVAWVLLLLSLGALAIVGGGCTSSGKRPVTTGKSTFKIGMPAPFSGSGAVYGGFMKQGAELAIDEINGRGGVNGMKLELVCEDGQGTPEGARAAAQKLIDQDKVNAMFCAFNSDATMGMLPVVKEKRIPLLVGLSAADPITEQGNPYVLRIASPNTVLAQAVCDYVAKSVRPKRVAIVYEKTNFGTEIAKQIRSALERPGTTMVAYEGVPQHQTEFMPLVSKLRAAKPDLVFLIVLMDSAESFLRQAKGAGLSARWANAVSLSNPKFLDDMKELAEGFIGVTYFVDSSQRPQAIAFTKAFKAKYNASTVTHYSAVYYDAVQVIADALKRGGADPNAFLDALKRTDLDGATGRINFDGKGQAHIGAVVFGWHNNQREVLSEYHEANAGTR